MGQLYRNGAPATSIDAADSIDATALQELVREVILNFGEKGCISDEVRDVLPDLAYSSVTARYRALLDKGLIEVIGVRRGRSGRNQRVMRAAWGRPFWDVEKTPARPKKDVSVHNKAIEAAAKVAEDFEDAEDIASAIRELIKL